MEKNLRDNLLSYLNHYGLEPLAEKDVRVSKDPRYPGLYNLKYGTLASDKGDPVVRACRGAVVAEEGGRFSLVAYAFDRFFNLGEPHADDIDWATAKVYEKYDGSLIKLFHWDGKWVVSTSGSVGGAGEVNSADVSFEDLFWSVFYDLSYRVQDLDTDNCYIFELCTLVNRVVVSYDVPELRLLTVRNRRDNFNELPLEDFAESFNIAQSFRVESDQLLAKVNERGADHEGFIVCDGNGRRIKVKSDVYVQLHRVRGNGEPDFSKLYLNDDLDEFLLHFPEYREQFQPLLDRLGDLNFMVNNLVDLYRDLSQKEFAEQVLKHHPKVASGMFAVRSGKIPDFLHYVADLAPKKLDELLGL